MERDVASTNFNSKWIDNIYENLKNLEIYIKMAKNGCRDLFEFFQVPLDSRIKELPQLQYKNLSLILTELQTLNDDISLLIDDNKYQEFNRRINEVKKVIADKDKLIEISKDLNGNIKTVKLTLFFDFTVDYLRDIKIDMLKEVKHLIWIDTTSNKSDKWKHQ